VRVEVVREVVLGEQVHHQRAAHRGRHLRVVGIERFVLFEVVTTAPRHQLVREPLLGGGEMAVEEARTGGFELREQDLAPHSAQRYSSTPPAPDAWRVTSR
jgi:hypothetical protein